MDRYFTLTTGSSFTDDEIDRLALFDIVAIKADAFSPYNSQPNLINKLRRKNGNQKVLLWIDAGWVNLSGTDGKLAFNGTASDPYPSNQPHNLIDFWTAHRCYSEGQYAVTSSGSVVTGNSIGPGYAMIDFTDHNPAGSDNLVFRQWLVNYLTTGVAARYDIDGFFLDNLHDDHTDGLAGDVDLNRDGAADGAAVKVSSWQVGVRKFMTELNEELLAINKKDFQLFSKGNFGDYNLINGYYWENFPESTWYSNIGTIVELEGSGVRTVLNYARAVGGATRTDFVGLTANIDRTMNRGLAVTYLTNSGMLHLDSGGHNELWYLESSFKKFNDPLTDVVISGVYRYKLYNDGIAICGTGLITGDTNDFYGLNLSVADTSKLGLLVSADPKKDWKFGNDQLQHGFKGIMGSGAGRHLNHPKDLITAEFMNKVEFAVENLHSFIEPNQGNFRFSGSDLYMQYYKTDGTATGFDMWTGINKWSLAGYNYTGGDPNPLISALSEVNKDTQLAYRLGYSTAPSSGYEFIFYNRPVGSALNSNAYLVGT